MLNVMIDIETLDIKPTAVVVSVGIVTFTQDETRDILYIDAKASIMDQISKGRTVDQDTVAWWKGKPTIDTLKSPCVSPSDLSELRRMIYVHTPPELEYWSRGSLDFIVLENLLVDCVPWKYWQLRDVRTLDHFVPKCTPTIPHNPVADCLAQIQQVWNVKRA